jgi:hypothetical protein
MGRIFSEHPAAGMRFPRLLLIALLNVFLLSPAAADDSAPFGLVWGMSVEQLREAGVDLRALQADDTGVRYSTSNLPKMLADLDEAILSFGRNNRLYRVEAVSRDFLHDIDGSRVKARYEALSRSLAAKYGAGRVTHDINKPWDRPEHFLMGLNLGSSRYYTEFESRTVSVRLAIEAKRRDTGVYVLIYLNKELARRSGEGAGESEVL